MTKLSQNNTFIIPEKTKPSKKALINKYFPMICANLLYSYLRKKAQLKTSSIEKYQFVKERLTYFLPAIVTMTV